MAQASTITVPNAQSIGAYPQGICDALQSVATAAAADVNGILGRQNAAKGADLTDAAATIVIGGGTWRVLPASTLSANRVLTLGTTGAVAGDKIEVTRLDTGAYTYAVANGGVGAGTLVTLAASKVASATFQFDGTNWALRTVGTL